jgi:hypothetical protein
MWSLSRKMELRPAKRIIPVSLSMIVFFLGTAAICTAQESSTDQVQGKQQSAPAEPGQSGQEPGGYRTVDILNPEPGQEQQQTEDADRSEALNPNPVPTQLEDETRSLGGQTLIDDVFQNSRNPWGFSLSVYGAYTNETSSDNEQDIASGIGAFRFKVFSNFGKRKSKLHLDAGTGYRRYVQHHALDSWDYNGNAHYSYEFSRETRFSLSDQFNSSYNDAWSFLSMGSSIPYNPNFSNEVLFNLQRINRNTLHGEISHQLTRKAQFAIFGQHSWFDYSEDTLANANTIEVGGRFGYRFTDWLSLSSRYSTYLYRAETENTGVQVHRLQVGQFDFGLTRSWRIWIGGGLDYSYFGGQNRFHENINAGIDYTSQRALFTVTYQRGFTSAIGINELLSSDVVAANYGYRITSWMHSNIEAYYYRNSEQSGGILETISGGGSLEFALQGNLSLTVNAFYQNQQPQDFSVEGLKLNRFSGYVGIQYVWPARRRY